MAAGRTMPEQAQGLPEQSYPFKCGIGEELMLFQQFSLHGNDVFDPVIGVQGYCVIESLSRTH